MVKQAETAAVYPTVKVRGNTYNVLVRGEVVRLMLAEDPRAWFETRGLTVDECAKMLAIVEGRYPYLRRQ